MGDCIRIAFLLHLLLWKFFLRIRSLKKLVNEEMKRKKRNERHGSLETFTFVPLSVLKSTTSVKLIIWVVRLNGQYFRSECVLIWKRSLESRASLRWNPPTTWIHVQDLLERQRKILQVKKKRFGRSKFTTVDGKICTPAKEIF